MKLRLNTAGRACHHTPPCPLLSITSPRGRVSSVLCRYADSLLDRALKRVAAMREAAYRQGGKREAAWRKVYFALIAEKNRRSQT